MIKQLVISTASDNLSQTITQQKWWNLCRKAEPEYADIVLDWLHNFKLASKQKKQPPKIKVAAFRAVNKFSGASDFHCKKLYRGVYPSDATSIEEMNKHPISFWTPNLDHAKFFAGYDQDDIDTPGVIYTVNYDHSKVLLNMIYVPYILGPFGREPELLLDIRGEQIKKLRNPK